MLSEITNFQLLITNKIQKTTLYAALFVLFAPLLFAGEPEAVTPTAKYSFRLYVLAKGEMKKNIERPDFGWRVLSTYPLKVKEYTYPAPYLDNSAPEFKSACDAILASIAEPRRKNAVKVADAVFDYVNLSITARDVNEEIADSPHRVYFSALQVLKEGNGDNFEKCRLATAMLRYFTIPARIVERDLHYEVEYYIQPLSEKGKGGWYLKDFEGIVTGAEEYFIPALWHPVDAKELLREEWASPMFLERTKAQWSYMGGGETQAVEAFEALTRTGKNALPEFYPDKKGTFYVIIETDYTLWLQEGMTEARAEFTLPFNIPDNFKTVKYYAVSTDERLGVKSKWPQTKTKPSQEGIIYTLPVSFKKLTNSQ